MNDERRPPIQAPPDQHADRRSAPDVTALPHLLIAGHEREALFVATDVDINPAWVNARGHWWRRSRGELGPERRYTWPRRRVLEVRWP
jgi:hypothetical protein